MKCFNAMFHCNSLSTKDQLFNYWLLLRKPGNQGTVQNPGVVTVDHHFQVNFLPKRRRSICRDCLSGIPIGFLPQLK